MSTRLGLVLEGYKETQPQVTCQQEGVGCVTEDNMMTLGEGD